MQSKADGEYSLATLCLRGNRDDYTALCLCNLLVVEPRSVCSRPDTYITKKIKHPFGCLIFCGGWGGIRTPGSLATSAVFKTVAFDRSATHPKLYLFDKHRQFIFCVLKSQLFFMPRGFNRQL